VISSTQFLSQLFGDALSRRMMDQLAGSTRRMNCNKSISKGLKAARIPKVIPSNYSMVNVYDVNAADGKGGYRMVNLNTITDIRTDGKLYLVQ
jgi:hypothetical protein